MTSNLKQAALDYAARGIPVFPCVEGEKVPATPRGFHDATTDANQIEAWWDTNPDFNIAFQPQKMGWAVIDPDDYAVPGGDALFPLELEYGALPETYTVRTARGGRHLYFSGSLPPSQGKLAPHVDTRGGGSYALLPPSRFEGGEYVAERNYPVADLPDWVPALIAERSKAKHVALDDVYLDSVENVDRAIAHLRAEVKAGHVATEGDSGDTLTYATACTLLNLGVSEEKTLDLMLEIWNPHCIPPWEPDDMAVKVANAATYAENEPGAWSVAPVQEVMADALAKIAAEQALEPEPTIDPLDHWFTIEELLELPEPKWLIKDAIMEEGTVLLFGPPKSFKTYAALQWCCEIAKTKEVAYVAGEDPRGVARRVKAWCKANEVDPKSLKLRVYPQMPALAVSPDRAKAFADRLVADGLNPSLLVLDTAARAMRGMNENDAKDAGLFVDVVDQFKRIFKSAVLVIHHSGKDEDGPRGSIVFVADFDTVHKVSREGSREAPVISVMNIAQRSAMEKESPWRFKGSNALGELVFSPIDDAAYYRAKAEADPFAHAKIGAILGRLSVPVTTFVLAHELVGQYEDEDARQHAADSAARTLARLSSGPLAGYCHGKGKDALWSLPALSIAD